MICACGHVERPLLFVLLRRHNAQQAALLHFPLVCDNRSPLLFFKPRPTARSHHRPIGSVFTPLHQGLFRNQRRSPAVTAQSTEAFGTGDLVCAINYNAKAEGNAISNDISEDV